MLIVLAALALIIVVSVWRWLDRFAPTRLLARRPALAARLLSIQIWLRNLLYRLRLMPKHTGLERAYHRGNRDGRNHQERLLSQALEHGDHLEDVAASLNAEIKQARALIEMTADCQIHELPTLRKKARRWLEASELTTSSPTTSRPTANV